MFYGMALAIALALIVIAILVPSMRCDIGSRALTLVFFFPLLFALSHPSGPPRQKGDVVPENAEEEARAGTVAAFSWFFWLPHLQAGTATGFDWRCVIDFSSVLPLLVQPCP